MSSKFPDVIYSYKSVSPSELAVEVNNGENDFKAYMSSIKMHTPTKAITSEGAMTKRAEMYQEYMKQIPIPIHRGSVIPFKTWMGLGKSIKELYGQPLRYLTNTLLKQWDRLRIGSSDEYRPSDSIMHPSKAEATIWLIEEAHRLTSSPHHVAKLWLLDPMHHASIDYIFPQLSSPY